MRGQRFYLCRSKPRGAPEDQRRLDPRIVEGLFCPRQIDAVVDGKENQRVVPPAACPHAVEDLPERAVAERELFAERREAPARPLRVRQAGQFGRKDGGLRLFRRNLADVVRRVRLMQVRAKEKRFVSRRALQEFAYLRGHPGAVGTLGPLLQIADDVAADVVARIAEAGVAHVAAVLPAAEKKGPVSSRAEQFRQRHLVRVATAQVGMVDVFARQDPKAAGHADARDRIMVEEDGTFLRHAVRVGRKGARRAAEAELSARVVHGDFDDAFRFPCLHRRLFSRRFAA
ncbi:MAG: hypothetical protein BWY37_01989 [Firmicutes bacterium ADurb.Bin262]|nr:MAG: hypothetical protein BWY37_01989 [Firmicutes bacterium ADurb.Bin262]